LTFPVLSRVDIIYQLPDNSTPASSSSADIALRHSFSFKAMSNYPPTRAFRGPQPHAQQWQYQPAPSASAESSILSYAAFFDSSATAGQQPAHFAPDFSYSNPPFTPGSQLPGLTMANTTAPAQPLPPDPPGPYANSFIQSQSNTTYQTPPSWTPPPATHPGSSAAVQTTSPSTAPHFRDRFGKRRIPHTTRVSDDQSAENLFDDDVDREEGEVSEGDTAHNTTLTIPGDSSPRSQQDFSATRSRYERDVDVNLGMSVSFYKMRIF
jgi:hypothetical protein